MHLTDAQREAALFIGGCWVVGTLTGIVVALVRPLKAERPVHGASRTTHTAR